MRYTIAAFGEAERGEFQTAFFCQTVEQLENYLGTPPKDSLGMMLSIQALMYDRDLIFFRVKEEGYSAEDYLYGLNLLENQHLFSEIHAIAMPGVGDRSILQASEPLCELYQSMLITTEADLYDVLTHA